MRTNDGNRADVVYYGLLPPGIPIGVPGCGTDGLGAGRSNDPGTLVHEIGHGYDFQHTPCGAAGATDPNYPTYEPYPSASIGEYGFNISNGQIFSPANTFDYMSYCGPQWMSLYQHNRLINHARLDPQFVGDEPIWVDKLEYREYSVEHDLPYPPPDPWKELETRFNPIIGVMPRRLPLVFVPPGKERAAFPQTVVALQREEPRAPALTGHPRTLCLNVLPGRVAQIAQRLPADRWAGLEQPVQRRHAPSLATGPKRPGYRRGDDFGDPPMTRFDIAQLNVGRAVAPLDSAVMADFMNWLDEINALAERSPGFVWRLQGDNGNNTELKVSDDPLFIVNLSVWSSIDALYDFTYRSDHRAVFKRRQEWFERLGRPNTVLWWQLAGTLPTAEESLARMDRLTMHGPTPDAFTFKEHFPPPHAGDNAVPARRTA